MSPEVQQAIVRMSGRLSDEEILMYLDILTCSVRCIMSHFRKYGTIPDAQEPAQEECQNNQQQLQGVDVEFLLNTIKKTPDLYLDELQAMVLMECGKDVS
ncbi:hypothetical protein SCLCIDRAFT_1222581 [Scleroderma citrinum Foug A]|uniref:Uncharacterized protein n=1 Tax=Scleroderma citrinum Foug A TaxID=1036808 RepID=A0A0C3CYT7_9AGAM|nr:hypothetical protein SCLCIDRAFT_1222581 [Scleroderma citrinum Foug A]